MERFRRGGRSEFQRLQQAEALAHKGADRLQKRVRHYISDWLTFIDRTRHSADKQPRQVDSAALGNSTEKPSWP
jgi:hypothetical protein